MKIKIKSKYIEFLKREKKLLFISLTLITLIAISGFIVNIYLSKPIETKKIDIPNESYLSMSEVPENAKQLCEENKSKTFYVRNVDRNRPGDMNSFFNALQVVILDYSEVNDLNFIHAIAYSDIGGCVLINILISGPENKIEKINDNGINWFESIYFNNEISSIDILKRDYPKGSQIGVYYLAELGDIKIEDCPNTPEIGLQCTILISIHEKLLDNELEKIWHAKEGVYTIYAPYLFNDFIVYSK